MDEKEREELFNELEDMLKSALMQAASVYLAASVVKAISGEMTSDQIATETVKITRNIMAGITKD